MGIERRLTEEQQKMLLGHAPFSTGVTIDFSPKEYENISDETIRPVYQVRGLTQDEQSQLTTAQEAYFGGDKSDASRQCLLDTKVKIAHACISGWKNRFDAGTKDEIVFSEENKKTIPNWEVYEIIAFVCEISFLTPPEELSVK